MKRELRVKIGAAAGVLLIACGALAERYYFVGHRATGMGGANAATVNDSSAQWHNPAAFGFFNRKADPVSGLQTNAVSNLVVNVEQVAVTNEIPTNVVESVTLTNEVPVDVVESVTNEVQVAAATTNEVPAETELQISSVTNTVMESQVTSTSLTNTQTELVETVMLTNEVPVEVVESVTNEVQVAAATTNVTPAEIELQISSLTNTVMESQVISSSVTNALTDYQVALLNVTNRHYDITDEVVDIEVRPDRSRVDNTKLEKNDFGWNIYGLGFGYTMTEDMPEYVTQVSEIDFDSFDGDGLNATAEAVESMILLSSALFGLGSNPDNAFYADATVGMNFRLGRVGIGVRGFSEATGFVDTLDTANLGIEQTIGAFVSSINSAAASDSGFDAATWITPQTITAGDLVAINAEDPDAELYIDYQLTQLKNDGVISGESIDDAVTMINLITYGQDPDNPASTSYENNKSTVTLRGFGLFEVPVSYGHAFNDNFSVGITAKGMYGTVTGTKFRFADGSELEDSIEILDENTEASLNFGIDLGAMYRMKMLQFAAVGHNLNAPKFEGFDATIEIENDAGVVVGTVPLKVPDYTLDPQVTVGAAFVPSKRFMVEVNYDLLETGTLLKNYDVQRLSFGTEFDIWLLALRLGMYNNLAVDWQDWIATGGVGVNLWLMRLDVGAAFSVGDNTDFEGSEIPEEARIYASLSMEF